MRPIVKSSAGSWLNFSTSSVRLKKLYNFESVELNSFVVNETSESKRISILETKQVNNGECGACAA